MRRFAVAAVLLVCLAVGCSAGPSTLPRPKTGGPSCTEPITRMTCFLDSTSGYVSGIRYGYVGQSGDTRVCAAATGSTVARGNSVLNTTTGVFQPSRTDTIISQDLPFQNALTPRQPAVNRVNQSRVGVTALEVMAFPGVRARGKIPAIKVYLADMNEPFDSPDFDLGYVVCGREDLVVDGALQTAAIYQSPVEASEDEFPRFLSYFVGKCSKRNLINNPNDPTFFLQQIQKPCWAEAYYWNNANA